MDAVAVDAVVDLQDLVGEVLGDCIIVVDMVGICLGSVGVMCLLIRSCIVYRACL